LSSHETVTVSIKEGQLLAKLNSPYVTRLIEANEDNGVAYLAIEFVDGSSVADLLKEKPQLDERLALSIVCDVAHGHEIIHRDIKPDNILLSWSGNELPKARLTDFGLAREVDQSESMELTQAGTLCGTPFYMSPEQWTGAKKVDSRSDIYGLGATLYRMLADRPPFEATQMAKLMAARLKEAPPALQKHNPSVNDGLVAIIEKSLAKDCDDRYSDTGELLEDLERLLRGEASTMVLHPQLPEKADQQDFMSWEFQWELESNREQLWEYVSNTDRFNRAMGLPPATFRTETAPGVGVRRFGETHLGPFSLKWEEHPFEWIQGRRFGVLREFSNGPFILFMSITELSDRPEGGTLLKHPFRIEPRGLIGRVASKF
jgi:serine/threonine protein kinase